MHYAMIMAGGAGTRLWPMSREDRPKQLLPILPGGRCLLEVAADRLEDLVPSERRYICTGRRYRELVEQALPQLDRDRILGEPLGRDTMNAIGFTAAVLAADDPDAVFAVLTADHLIEPQDEFQRKLQLGMRLVDEDPSRFITFMIQPTFPATGYGYIERGESIDHHTDAFHTRRFVEKPDRAKAEEYLASGRFGWNSGMFVFHAATYLQAVRKHHPEAYDGLQRIGAAWKGPQAESTLGELYPVLPKISVDYGIMEPTSRDTEFTICAVRMDVQWLDLGSWPAFGETLEPDASGHRTHGHAVHLDSQNVLSVSDDPEHTITTIGCADLIIVHTADATLVCPAKEAQRVKELQGFLDEDLR